jgi:site-specific recombinase XerD
MGLSQFPVETEPDNPRGGKGGIFFEFLPDWARHMRVVRGLQMSTVNEKVRRVNEFLAWLQTEDIAAIDIENYLEHLFYAGNSTATRRGKISTLSTFFEFLVLRGVLSADPSSGITLPRRRRAVVHSFTRSDVLKLFAAIDINSALGLRNAVVLILGVFAGFRVSEIMHLRLCDVFNEDERAVLIVQEYDGFEPKWGSTRRIKLWKAPSVFVFALQAARLNEGASADDILIVSKNGRHMTRKAVGDMLKRLCDTAGLRRPKIEPKMMRTTCAASLRFVDGYDAFAIAQYLGHTDWTSVKHYISDWERVPKKYSSLALYWQGFAQIWGGEHRKLNEAG